MRKYEKEKRFPGYVIAGFYILAGCLICFTLFLYGSSLEKNPLASSGSVFPVSASAKEEENPLSGSEDTKAPDAPAAEETEAQAPATPAACTFVTLNTRTALHVRIQPGMDAEIIARLSPGTTGDVLERGEAWSLIRTSDVTGYVSNRYLQFQEVPKEAEAASQ